MTVCLSTHSVHFAAQGRVDSIVRNSRSFISEDQGSV